jgi:hypothetical protein
MARDEFVWLIVRAIGAFLLAFVALELIGLLIVAVQAAVLRFDLLSGSIEEKSATIQATIYGRHIERIWYSGFDIALTGLCSYYCFYHGAWLHKLLISRVPVGGES